MPNLKSDDKLRRRRRAQALERSEFRAGRTGIIIQGSVGLTSPAIKSVEPELRAKIDTAIALRNGVKQ